MTCEAGNSGRQAVGAREGTVKEHGGDEEVGNCGYLKATKHFVTIALGLLRSHRARTISLVHPFAGWFSQNGAVRHFVS